MSGISDALGVSDHRRHHCCVCLRLPAAGCTKARTQCHLRHRGVGGSGRCNWLEPGTGVRGQNCVAPAGYRTIPIRAYALCILIGVIVALFVGDRRWAARGGERGVIFDIALWAVMFGLIGGRLYHVLTDWHTYFGPGGAGLWAAFGSGTAAWASGVRSRSVASAHGSAVGGGEFRCRRSAMRSRPESFWRRRSAGSATISTRSCTAGRRRFRGGWRSSSAAMPNGALDSLNGVSTGQVIAIVHPTFLYELLWNLLVFVLLIWVDRRYRIGHGRLFALYVAAYCFGRFWIELMRSDEATHIAGIRINSFMSVFVFIGAVVYIMVAPKGREDPSELRGKAAVDVEAAPDVEVSPVDELAMELAGVAATTGVVAAAKVAGEKEDEDAEAGAAAEDEGEEPDIREAEAAPAEEPEAEEAEAEEEPEVEAVAEAEQLAEDVADAPAEDIAEAEAFAKAGEEAEAADQRPRSKPRLSAVWVRSRVTRWSRPRRRRPKRPRPRQRRSPSSRGGSRGGAARRGCRRAPAEDIAEAEASQRPVRKPRLQSHRSTSKPRLSAVWVRSRVTRWLRPRRRRRRFMRPLSRALRKRPRSLTRSPKRTRPKNPEEAKRLRPKTPERLPRKQARADQAEEAARRCRRASRGRRWRGRGRG